MYKIVKSDERKNQTFIISEYLLYFNFLSENLNRTLVVPCDFILTIVLIKTYVYCNCNSVDTDMIMYCIRLYAWWLTQSRLAILLSALIASW